MNKDIPRRIRLDLMTPEELGIYNMVGEVEKLGAHPLLTDVVVLLGNARGKLSDWVDLQAAEQSPAGQSDGACTCAHIERPMVDKQGICFSCRKPRR